MNASVTEALAAIRAYRQAHFDLGKYMFGAFGGAFYPLDILATATLNRSLSLLTGFCSLIEATNFISAAPLVRLELDNCLRFSASWYVAQPHDFALRVLEGIPVKEQRDAHGRRLTDKYLVDILSKEKPWIRPLYEATSGYIHLSERHIFNAMRASPEEDGVLHLKIGDADAFVSDGLYLEAIGAFKAVTELLFEYIYGWAWTKDNPQLVADMKRKRGIT